MPEIPDTQKPLSFEVHQLDNDEIVGTITLEEDTRINYLCGTEQDKAKIIAWMTDSASGHFNKKCYVCEYEPVFDNIKPKLPTKRLIVITDELSIDQAKKTAITNGSKIKHPFFDIHEYIYFKNGDWFDENDRMLSETFWYNMGEKWQNNWTAVD